MHHSLTSFDNFFYPTTIVVVSEERLKAAELKAKEDRLESIEDRIKHFESYRDSLKEEIKNMTEPQSLEEALTGG
jgi:vacuolar-type H+-ATPase subunit E/Vma4